jgi:hypothetical protein
MSLNSVEKSWLNKGVIPHNAVIHVYVCMFQPMEKLCIVADETSMMHISMPIPITGIKVAQWIQIQNFQCRKADLLHTHHLEAAVDIVVTKSSTIQRLSRVPQQFLPLYYSQKLPKFATMPFLGEVIHASSKTGNLVVVTAQSGGDSIRINLKNFGSAEVLALPQNIPQPEPVLIFCNPAMIVQSGQTSSDGVRNVLTLVTNLCF